MLREASCAQGATLRTLLTGKLSYLTQQTVVQLQWQHQPYRLPTAVLREFPSLLKGVLKGNDMQGAFFEK